MNVVWSGILRVHLNFYRPKYCFHPQNGSKEYLPSTVGKSYGDLDERREDQDKRERERERERFMGRADVERCYYRDERIGNRDIEEKMQIEVNRNEYCGKSKI
jgi:hypothetical protein